MASLYHKEAAIGYLLLIILPTILITLLPFILLKIILITGGLLFRLLLPLLTIIGRYLTIFDDLLLTMGFIYKHLSRVINFSDVVWIICLLGRLYI